MTKGQSTNLKKCDINWSSSLLAMSLHAWLSFWNRVVCRCPSSGEISVLVQHIKFQLCWTPWHAYTKNCDLVQDSLYTYTHMHFIGRKITLWKQYTLTDDTLLNVVGKHPQTIAFHHCKGTVSARTLQAAFQRLSAHVKVFAMSG